MSPKSGTKLLAANHSSHETELNFTLNRNLQNFFLKLWHYHQQILVLIHNFF